MLKRNLDRGNNGGMGIEVRFFQGWFDKAPKCEHGPMLLFERYIKGKQASSYYACSANRDHKHCSQLLLECDDLKISPKKHSLVLHEDIHTIQPENRHYCYQCQQFLLDKSQLKQHENHKLIRNISDTDLLQPSTLFIIANQNDKVHAQYFLSKRSTKFLQSCMETIKTTHVLCIGMPRIHESIQLSSPDASEKTIKSILLDIDPRYASFWKQDKFLQFNMFNHYFFNQSSQNVLHEFIKDASKMGNQLSVVLDPPFGGLVDCIAECLGWLQHQISKLSPVMNTSPKIFWLFPYFMESRIVASLPHMTMMDYCVDYENHKKFKNSPNGRKSSPVRIFTNVENRLLKLPLDEGYRFCDKCKRYVSQMNTHCLKCGTCPSKDGRTYIHCGSCRKCVKPGRKHCSICERCELPDHTCSPNFEQVGCHICGQITHKRRECPLVKKPVPPSDEDTNLVACNPKTEGNSCLRTPSKRRIIYKHNPSHHRKFKRSRVLIKTL